MAVTSRSTLLLATVTALLAALGLTQPAGAAPPGRGTVLFVAPWGDDTGPGTAFRPFRTPQHAQDVVRTLDATMSGDITVELESGTYRLTTPLALDGRDSGTNGHTIRWTAAPGAHPIFSGGTRITGWQLTDPAHGIWSAPAPAGLQTRQLYVDGVRAQRASGAIPTRLTVTPTGYTAADPIMSTWRNPSDIEFVYTGGVGYWSLHTGGSGAWTEPRCPVASIVGTTITMAQPCWDNSNKRVLRTDGSGRTVELVGPQSLGNGEIPAYVENAFELLTQPGQWYLDRGRNTVYYLPRPGEHLARADVEVPVLQSLVTGQHVHDVAFNGIQFSYATWLTPNTPEGFSEIQANFTITGQNGFATQGLCQFIAGGTCPYGDWTELPGNVSFTDDTDIALTDDVFTHLGAAGVDLGDGSQHDLVQGDVFTDISGNGLEIGGVDMPEPATPADRTGEIQVLDNHLYDMPVEYHGGVAIDVGYLEHLLISHNQIDHTSYTGISLGWGGWPDKIKVAATPNFSNDNTVSDNLITDTMQFLGDGGGIYTQGITGTSLADGEHLTGNVIRGALDLGHALYSDNGSTFMTLTGNVEFGNENDWGSRHTDFTAGATGDDPLDLENNWWQQGDAPSTSNNVTEANNHIITSLRDVPAQILRAAGLEPRYRHLLGVVGPFAVPDPPTQVAAFAANGSAYVAWNPSFVDHGLPVAGYTVTASPGGARVQLSAGELRRVGHVTVPGLANGTAYTFTVTATNAAGTSAATRPTDPVTPTANLGAVPNPPASVSAHVDGDNVSLHWNPPATVGGTPIIAYTVRAPGLPPVTVTGHTVDWATSSRNIFTTLTGFRPGQPYTLSITADNVAGASAPSTVTVVPGTTAGCTGAHLALSPASTTATPGGTVQVTTTLTDGCTSALSAAKVYLSATNGYRVSPASPVSGGDLAVGGSATQTWTVTAPSDATTGSTLSAAAVFGVAGQAEATTTTGTITLPAASLAAAFDNIGVTDDANPTIGNIDGAGSSFSAEALQAAGVTPGGSVTADGVSFTWPNVSSGADDNAVATGGAFDLSGTGSTLSFLLTATYGPATGTGQVVYTDGTTSTFTVTVPDWHAGCTSATAPGVAVYTPYRNRPTGKNTLPVCVFTASTPLSAGKTVARVVLPHVSDDVVQGSPALHVFAATIG